MTHFFKISVLLLVLSLLPGCVADQRDRRMVQPLEKAIAPYDNGAIFKVGFNERPLFEDRRARNVGDSLIMTVAESADAIAQKEAAKKAAAEAKKSADNGGDAERADRGGQGRRLDDNGDEYITNLDSSALVGNMPMTVMEVLENGNLFVSGGKMVTVDDVDQYVRITGIVDPVNITAGNVVASNMLSDAKINVDDLRIYTGGTAIKFTEGHAIFGDLFQSVRQ
ncbi:MAG: flagellar basal body L-ring protein FlgH [Gallionellaceae bacterium]|jgi:flagellar L-ring protein precursor FlgH